MSVPTNNTISSTAATTARPDADKAVDKSKEAPKMTTSDAKHQLNSSIVQKSLDVSLSSKNDPLSLVYKTAIENLNEVLAPELGPNAIEKAAASGEEQTPEATAVRILSFVMSMYEIYRGQHKKDDSPDAESAMAEKFVSIVQGGIDKGFKEARGILAGMQVLEGSIASNIDKTYDLIQQGLTAFIETKKTPPVTEPKDASVADTVAPNKTKPA